MSKKVLVLSGSPRKGGNSDLLCDQFMSGAKDAGNSVEKVLVAAMDNRKEAMESTLEGFRGFTSRLHGAKEKGIIYGTGATGMGEIKSSLEMGRAYDMGKNI